MPTVPSSATTSSEGEAKAEQKYRDLLQKLRKTPDSLTPEISGPRGRKWGPPSAAQQEDFQKDDIDLGRSRQPESIYDQFRNTGDIT